MTLSKSSMEQFKTIYFEEFGIRITDDDALVLANRVLSFFTVIINEDSNNEVVNNFSKRGGVLNDNKNKSNRV